MSEPAKQIHEAHALQASLDELAKEAATAPGPGPGRGEGVGHRSAEPASADLVGNELASQIQELLDDAKRKQEAAPPPAAPAPADTAQAIGHIDSELAASADNAIAGDFETVQEVMNAAASPAALAHVPPVPPVIASAQDPSPVGSGRSEERVVAPAQTAAHQTASQAAAPAPTAVHHGATAADVARELDADQSVSRSSQANQALAEANANVPEANKAVTAAVAVGAAVGAGGGAAKMKVKKPSKLVGTIRKTVGAVLAVPRAVGEPIRSIMGLINSPLMGQTSTFRFIVGAFGLQLLLTGAVLITRHFMHHHE